MGAGNSLAMTFEGHTQCEALRSAVTGSLLADERRAKLRGVRVGEMLWNPASKPDRVFQLRSGRVNIVSSDSRGNETVLHTIKAGEIFGEICLCSHADAPHGTSAVAVNRSEILEAGYEEFRARLKVDPDLMNLVLRLFCKRLADADCRVQILAEHDARRRLRRLLAYIAVSRGTPSKRSQFWTSVTITHAELASLGALSRPHLSLLMTEFREKGLVSYERGSVLRIDMAKISLSGTYIP